jgi:hypothetical protein
VYVTEALGGTYSKQEAYIIRGTVADLEDKDLLCRKKMLEAQFFLKSPQFLEPLKN